MCWFLEISTLQFDIQVYIRCYDTVMSKHDLFTVGKRGPSVSPRQTYYGRPPQMSLSAVSTTGKWFYPVFNQLSSLIEEIGVNHYKYT